MDNLSVSVAQSKNSGPHHHISSEEMFTMNVVPTANAKIQEISQAYQGQIDHLQGRVEEQNAVIGVLERQLTVAQAREISGSGGFVLVGFGVILGMCVSAMGRAWANWED